MESALTRLNIVRRKILASREWRELQGEAALLVDSSAPILVQGTKKCMDNASKPLSKEVPKRLQHTQPYKELKMKIAILLAQHFLSGPSTQILHHVNDQSISDYSTSDMTYACVHLLQANANLKQQLKSAFNHPLPSNLRGIAWKALLVEEPLSPAEKQAIQQKLQKLGLLRLERQTVNKKLRNLLESTPTLSVLSTSSAAMGILKTVGFYWKQENDGFLTNSDLLLLVPFAKVWSKYTSTQEMNCEVILFEVLEVFTSFMRKLPPTMAVKIVENEVQQRAIEEFCNKIAKLLRANDHKLYNHLEEIFDASDPNPIHKHLAHLLKSSIQNMLVGDLPLDVVLYIWDQCFIGNTVPHYQCLHYFVTVWLTILRQELMTCTNSKGVREVLTRNAEKLTIAQFQRKIQEDYLNTLAAELQITPIRVQSTVKEEIPRNSSEKIPHSMPASMDSWVSSEQELDTEKEQLRLDVRGLQKEIARQRKVLTLKVEKEKLKRKQEVQVLHQEVVMLQKRANRRPPTPFATQPPNASTRNKLTRPVSSLTTSTVSSTQPTAGASNVFNSSYSAHKTSISSPSSKFPSLRVNSNPLAVDQMSRSITSSNRATSSITDDHSSLPSLGHNRSSSVFSRVTTLSSSPASASRAVSPLAQISQSESTQMSLEDAQQVWLRIFKRFSCGLSLLCHGAKEDITKNSSSSSIMPRDASN